MACSASWACTTSRRREAGSVIFYIGLPGAQGSPGDFDQGEYHFMINSERSDFVQGEYHFVINSEPSDLVQGEYHLVIHSKRRKSQIIFDWQHAWFRDCLVHRDCLAAEFRDCLARRDCLTA